MHEKVLQTTARIVDVKDKIVAMEDKLKVDILYFVYVSNPTDPEGTLCLSFCSFLF